MLSIKPVKSASGAAKYYNAEDNYYLSDIESLDKASSWYGKGAFTLSLSGMIEREAFLSLLQGRLPSGQQLGIKNEKGEIEHRPATDVTLSAPKSVSLLSLVGGDERLIKAHEKAVSKTLDAIEDQIAEARITEKGETRFEKTKNLVVAQFQHTSSRELDPQLHNHCLILNMTERSDGKWRALSSKSKNDKEHNDNGFREQLYKNQHYFGLIYTSELAKEIRALGYDIEVKDEYGNFEIKGLPKAYLEHTSKRRVQILNRLQELSLTSAKAAEKANLDLRSEKETVDNASLKEFWREEAEKYGIDFERLIAQSKSIDAGDVQINEDLVISADAKEALNDALDHLSEFNTHIKHASLIKEAFKFAVGLVSHEELEQELSNKLQTKEILGIEHQFYTSKNMLKREEQFIAQFRETKKRGFAIDVEGASLSANILRSKDAVHLIDIQGLSSEKELLQELVQTTEEEGFRAFILNQGKFQAARINDTIHRDSSTWKKWFFNLFKPNVAHTVSGFKFNYEQQIKQGKAQHDVLIIHDAQKLSYNDLSDLERLAQKNQSKLILLNNQQSRAGSHAGNPITALREAQIISQTSQQSKPEHLIEIHPTQHGKEDVAACFAKMGKEEREQTHVIALTNKDHKDLTESIRAHLQNHGEISWHTREITVLGNEYLSEAQRKHLKFYEPGYQITLSPFTKNQENLKIVAKDEHHLVAQDKNGIQKNVTPSMLHDALVTKTKPLEIGAGDVLCSHQDFMIGQFKMNKGQQFYVTDIQSDGVVLSHNGKSRLYFSNEELTSLKLDYDYVKKPSHLKNPINHALVPLKSYQINQNCLGEIAEFAKTVRLYTEDKDKAREALVKEQLRYTIKESIENSATMIYRDCSFAPIAIKDSLKQLEEIFKKSGLDSSETVISKALHFAIAKLGEREAAISHYNLLKEAVVSAMGKASVTDIEKALSEKQERGELIHANTYWITPQALKVEQQILANNKNAQNCLSPILEKEITFPEHLTHGQKSAVSLVLGTRDRFVSVQGLAGVGKTTMMQVLQQKAEASGYHVVGLAPMHTSKEELIANKIDAQTIAQFLVEDKKFDDKTLFIIDECSMIGNEDYLNIQEKIKSFNARAVFSGDITQLQSPTAGIPHELTIKTTSQKQAKMSEIMRQNANPILKEGVLHAINKNIDDSFNQLNKINPEDYIKRSAPLENETKTSVTEISCFNKKEKKTDYTPIYRAIANDYLSRIPEHQEKTLVIAHAHEDRKIINSLIREGLKEQGQIAKEEISCIRLKNVSLTNAELLDVNHFKPGQIIRFEKNYSVAEKGGYLKIEGLDKEKNLLHCLEKGKIKFSINPAKIAIKSGMTVYEEEQVNLASGDRIRLKLSQKNISHIANKEYTIESLFNQKAHLKNEEGSLVIDLTQLEHRHWDYAYSTTAFGAQGQTSPFVIALELAKRRQATSYRAHIIDVTRPRAQVTIYTENQQALIERYKKFEGDKTSAWLVNGLKKTGEIQIKSELNKSQEISSKNNNKKLTFERRQETVQKISDALTAQFENLAHHLLGEPNQKLSSSNNLRYGSKGSLSLNLQKGLWHNFETGEKGNALQLIAMQMGFSDFKDTVGYAKDYLNYEDNKVQIRQVNPIQKIRHKESNNKKQYAEKLFNQSRPIHGTLAEAYLKNRGILEYKSEALRFLPRISTLHDKDKTHVPALLCVAKDEEGKINHVQVIRLDPISGDKDKQSNIAKQTYGSINGIGIELNKHGNTDVTFLTEGVETGLSILESDKNANVLALLSKSNFANVNLKQLGNHVVLCLDNDGEKTFSDNLIRKAVERLEQAGKKISIVLPDKSGTDFNDTLKSRGILGVRSLINKTISGHELLKNYEKFSQFTGDTSGLFPKEQALLKDKKISDPLTNNIMPTQAHRITSSPKELVLER
ncbi:conjugative transfer relaxase/helicase TraI [Legionella septentrionalis]|uniref:conjugative transfer relaxase/helicase TraI n=1 Tax=Legionella septentrionalis TaxID=2498109 RepID=UPI000F8DC4A0|nr:conjugative transfer relaxase/helicase TraI [Legionella septentrionalis]RUQ96664.1 conjugative transfer relaxase/helicase TraI [Legionella septentrionalis]